MEEPAEFVDFTFHFDYGASVVLHEAAVSFHLLVEFLSFLAEIAQVALLLQNAKEERRFSGHILMLLNKLINFVS